MTQEIGTKTKEELFSTRLFILLLIISFVILISYYVAERVSINYEFPSPTFDQFIRLENEQHSNPTLSCPCSSFTTAYKDMIQIEYTLHSLCSSNFVQPEWLDLLSTGTTLYHTYDFRRTALRLFTTLASYCKIAIVHIDNSLIRFNATFFVADHALGPLAYAEEIQTIVDAFKTSTTRAFSRDLSLMSNMTRNNQLMSGQATNYNRYPVFTGYPDIYFMKTEYMPQIDLSQGGLCYCVVNRQCYTPMLIYSNSSFDDTDVLDDIPGLYLGCLLDEGIRHSTLVCLFNQSCVDVMSFWLNISSVNAIGVNNHFDSASTVSSIVNKLLVDQWAYVASHRAFYEQCAPLRCIYTTVEHNSFWLILTTVFALIGGLMKILQICVPHLVHALMLLYVRCRRRDSPPLSASSPFSFRRIFTQLREINLFRSDDAATDNARETQDQLISTRLFVVLFLVSLVVLTVYLSQVQVTKTVAIAEPSSEQYFSLHNDASRFQTLTCPCKKIAIPQYHFITLQPSFHQVCQSDFVDSRWSLGLAYTTNANLHERLSFYDFRYRMGYIFGTIASLCNLSKTAIDDELLDFGHASFITTQVIPQAQLREQAQSRIDSFISTTQNAFISSLQTIRDTTQANFILEGAGSTADVYLITVGHWPSLNAIQYANYRNFSCNCHDHFTCTQPAALYRYFNGTPVSLSEVS